MSPGLRRFVLSACSLCLWFQVVAGGATPTPTPTPPVLSTELKDEDWVREAKGVIGPDGGRIVSPDGSVEVTWAPNPARPPTASRVWSIIAPGGAGFHVNGAAGPASVRCWPPGSGPVPGSPGAAGDPMERGAAPPGSSDEGGVEVLGRDREWTTVESTLHKDGSREIRFIDERGRIKTTGLVKAKGSGRKQLEPSRVELLRGQSARFRWVNTPQAQKDWKDAVADDEELAPITPVRKGAGKTTPPSAKTDDPDTEELAPIGRTKGDPEIDELAPIGRAKGDPDIDDLAPLRPSSGGPSSSKGGTP